MSVIDIPVLSHEEYDKLYSQAQRGMEDTLVPFFIASKVEAEHIFDDEWNVPVTKGIRTIFLNVAETSYYMNKSSQAIIVFPETQELTYAMVNDIYPGDDKPWAYVLRYKVEDDLDEWLILFDDKNNLEPFILENTVTH